MDKHATKKPTPATHANRSAATALCESALKKIKLGHLDEAEQDCHKAITYDPDAAFAHYLLGCAKHHQGAYTCSVDCFSTAIACDNEFASAYCYRGQSFFKLEDYRQAFADYNKSLELDPKCKYAHTNLGNIYHLRENYSQALRSHGEAIRIDPFFSEAFGNRAIVRMAMGEMQEAIKDCSRAICYDKENAIAFGNRGNAKYKSHDAPGGISDVEQSIRLTKAAHARSVNSRAHRTSLSVLYFNLGVMYFSGINKPEDSLRCYDQAIKYDPNNATAFANRGHVYMSRGKRDSAIQDWKKANEIAPTLKETSPHLWVVHEHATRSIASEAILDKLFALIGLVAEIHARQSSTSSQYSNAVHFANIHTLANIAAGGRFRAYAASTMDDDTEGSVFHKMIEQVCRAKYSSSKQFESITKLISNKGIHVYLSSFVRTSQPVLANDAMWQKYGKHEDKPAAGCALVVNKSAFTGKPGNSWGNILDHSKIESGSVSSDECYLIDVIYDEKMQREDAQRFASILQDIASEDDSEKATDLAQAIIDLVRYLYKRKSFSCENEARLIIFRHNEVKEDGIIRADELRNGRRYVLCPQNVFPHCIILGPKLTAANTLKIWLNEQIAFKHRTTFKLCAKAR